MPNKGAEECSEGTPCTTAPALLMGCGPSLPLDGGALRKEITLAEVLEAQGFGRYQIRLGAIMSVGWAADGMEMCGPNLRTPLNSQV